MKVIWLFVISAACCAFDISFCGFSRKQPKSEELRQRLMEQCWQMSAPQILPKSHLNKPIDIDVTLELLRLVSIIDTEQTMSIMAEISFTWEIECLKWNEEEEWNGIYYLTIKDEQMWKPLVHHLNAVKIVSAVDWNSLNMILITNQGMIYWGTAGRYDTTCNFNFKHFPFENQKCDIVLQLFQTTSEVQFRSAKILPVSSDFNSEGSIFEFTNATATFQANRLQVTAFDRNRIVFTLYFKRKPDFYITNIFLPLFGLTAIMLSSLLMPPETERCSFVITVLLAFAVLQNTINDNIPQTSDHVYLVYYIAGQIALGTCITIYTVISAGLSRNSYFKHTISFKHFPSSFRVARIRIVDFTTLFIAFLIELLMNAVYFGTVLLTLPPEVLFHTDFNNPKEIV